MAAMSSRPKNCGAAGQYTVRQPQHSLAANGNPAESYPEMDAKGFLLLLRPVKLG